MISDTVLKLGIQLHLAGLSLSDTVFIQNQGEYLRLEAQDESDNILHEHPSVAVLSFQSVVSIIVTS